MRNPKAATYLKRHLPNALTCLNLLCGCLALTFILTDKDGYAGLTTGALFVGVAAIADFLDGLVARALRVSSPIGKDLDSLADMVSFGVVPGAILFSLLSQFGDWGIFSFSGFIVTIFSALRLAKFNNDTRQTTSFIGLPTPACTLVVASLPLILENASSTSNSFLLMWLTNPWLLLGLTYRLSGQRSGTTKPCGQFVVPPRRLLLRPLPFHAIISANVVRRTPGIILSGLAKPSGPLGCTDTVLPPAGSCPAGSLGVA